MFLKDHLKLLVTSEGSTQILTPSRQGTWMGDWSLVVGGGSTNISHQVKCCLNVT